MNTVSITRGTTPTHVFYSDVSLENVSELYITYNQYGSTIVEKNLDDVTIDINENSITVPLTQQETLLFKNKNWSWLDPNRNISYGNVRVQCRIKFEDGNVIASDIISIDIDDILKDGEI